LEKRLASLDDLGTDTVGLRNQLAFARAHLAYGRIAEVLSICDEIEATTHRLAKDFGGEQLAHTGQFTSDQLAQAMKDILSGGLLEKLLAEHRDGSDAPLQTRLRDWDEKVLLHMASEVETLRAEQQVLRQEIEQMRQAMDRAPVNTSTDHPLDEANADTGSTTVYNQPIAAATDWATPLITSLQAIVERLQSPTASTEAPAWVTAVVGNLQIVADKLSVNEHAQEINNSDIATALSAVVDRGLAGLGELIRQGQQSGSQGKQPVDDTSIALSPMTLPTQEEDTTRVFGQSSTRTNKQQVRITPALSDSLRSLVIHEVEARLGQTSIVTAKDLKPEEVRAIIAAEFDRRAGGAIERNDINDLRANVVRLLPSLLEDEAVRQQLFAVLALEAISKPGALAELTGLRSFLKRELNSAAEELAGRLQTT
jgi:hypothetical protein